MSLNGDRAGVWGKRPKPRQSGFSSDEILKWSTAGQARDREMRATAEKDSVLEGCILTGRPSQTDRTSGQQSGGFLLFFVPL